MKQRMTAIAWAVVMFLVLTACGFMAAEALVLPSPEDLKEVTVTASELELTAHSGDWIAQLLEALEQGVREKTGRASVADTPAGKGAGLMRLDFGFKNGGTSTLFLYREDGRLFLEQPYQGIYEMDASLEYVLRSQIALAMARQQTTKQE